ncbi:hypothetical protein AB8Q18_11095 [Neisseriaceae bacterium CLB008]|nr:hypothetical protein [Neisseriaceae bacterium]
MLGRILRIFLIIAVVLIIINRLFSRSQKREMTFWVSVLAYAFLGVSVVALALQLFRAFF